jgi:ATP-dependent Clp protease ATP-binding subunit ClpC
MPKINVYLPDALADAVREAQLPVSAICQSALERAVRDITSARASDEPPPLEGSTSGVFSRFTPRARQALTLAEEAARQVPHNYVGTEHLLLGVLDEGGNLALRILAALEIEPDDVRAELIASMGRPTRPAGDRIPFKKLAKEALELTAKEALLFGHNYIGCEHLLLGLLATERGIASQVLRRMGLEVRTARRATITALVGFVHAQQAPAAAAAPVSQTGVDDESTLEQILRRLDAIESRLAPTATVGPTE